MVLNRSPGSDGRAAQQVEGTWLLSVHSRAGNHGIHQTVETYHSVCLTEFLPITVLHAPLEQVVKVERQEVCLVGTAVLDAETLREKIAQVEDPRTAEDNLPVENGQDGCPHTVTKQ